MALYTTVVIKDKFYSVGLRNESSLCEAEKGIDISNYLSLEELIVYLNEMYKDPNNCRKVGGVWFIPVSSVQSTGRLIKDWFFVKRHNHQVMEIKVGIITREELKKKFINSPYYFIPLRRDYSADLKRQRV